MSLTIYIIQDLLKSFKFNEAKNQLMTAAEDNETDLDIEWYKKIIHNQQRCFVQRRHQHQRSAAENILDGNIAEAWKYVDGLRECGVDVSELEKKIEAAEHLKKTERHLALVRKLLAQEYYDVTEIHSLICEARGSLDLANTTIMIYDKTVVSKQLSELEKEIKSVELMVGTEKNIALAHQCNSKWFLEEAKKCFHLAKQYNIPQKFVEQLQSKIDASEVIFHPESNKTDDAEYLQKGEKHIVLAKDLLAQDYHDLTEIYRLISNARCNLNLAKTVDIPSEHITKFEKEIKAVEMIVGTEKYISLAQQCNPKWYLEEANKYIGLAKQYDIPHEKVEELQSKIDAADSMIQAEFNAQDKGPILDDCRDTKVTAKMCVPTLDKNNYNLQKTNVAKPEQHVKEAATQLHSEILIDPMKRAVAAKDTSKGLEVYSPEQIQIGENPDINETLTILENVFEIKQTAHSENLVLDEQLLTNAEKCTSLARKALTEGHVEIAGIIVLIAKKLFPEGDFSRILADIFVPTSKKSSEIIPHTDSTDKESGYDISKQLDKALVLDNEGKNLATNIGNIDMKDKINIAESEQNNNEQIALEPNEISDVDDNDADTFNRVSADTQLVKKSDANSYSKMGNPPNATAMEIKSKDINYPTTNQQAKLCLDIASMAFEQGDVEKCNRFLSEAKIFDNAVDTEGYLINLKNNQVEASLKPAPQLPCLDAAMEDFNARSEATFRFTVPNFRNMKVEHTVLSPPFFVRNLPWKIMVKPSGRRKQKSFGFFLQCNEESESTSWSCYAKAELRLISHKPGTEPFSKKIQHLFCSKENDWGFSHFMLWNDVLDPQKGYLKDDTVTLEVHVTAEAPQDI